MSSDITTKTTPKKENFERKLEEIRERSYVSRTSGGVKVLEKALPLKKKRGHDSMDSIPSSPLKSAAIRSNMECSPSSAQALKKEKLRKIELDKKESKDLNETKPAAKPLAAVYAAKLTRKSRSDLLLESLEGGSDQAVGTPSPTRVRPESLEKSVVEKRTGNRTIAAEPTHRSRCSQTNEERKHTLIRPKMDHQYSDYTEETYGSPTAPSQSQEKSNSPTPSTKPLQIGNDLGSPPPRVPVEIIRKGQSFIDVLDALATYVDEVPDELPSPTRPVRERQPPPPAPHPLNTNTMRLSGAAGAELHDTRAWSPNQFKTSNDPYSRFQRPQINSRHYLHNIAEQPSTHQSGYLPEGPMFRFNAQEGAHPNPNYHYHYHPYPPAYPHTPHQVNPGTWNFNNNQCESLPPPAQPRNVQHMWGWKSREGRPGIDYPLGQSFIPPPQRKIAPNSDKGWFNQWM